MSILPVIACLVIGYFLGCFQTAYFMGKKFGKIDIRDFGSGNAGTTNVARVMGAKVGAVVFITDVLKAVAAFIICSLLFGGGSIFFSGANGLLPGMLAGIGVTLGHNFPFFMKFKGGKGFACSIGVILCTDWRVALVCFVLGFFGIFITKFMSVAALTVTGLFPICMLIFGHELASVLLSLFFTAMVFYQHKSNIKRLISGTENKFKIKKQIEKK